MLPRNKEEFVRIKAYMRDQKTRQQVMEDNVAKLTVYPESMDLTVMEDIPDYTARDLLSDFGE